ncbi:hypothetical protein [Oceanobacillus jeddahense]|uniref:hypothetical protein n=1 Tax=Oceanobacillus jeddahense TaxID=1462527 RepID=UPI000595C1F7|nr:hypothetical protein [Oceanobacillus jeddahense]
MNKKQWLTVIGGVIVLSLAVFLILYFNNRETAGETAGKEAEGLSEEERKELEERAGIDDLISIEEASAALREAIENEELDKVDHEFIEEKFGEKHSRAYLFRSMYSETDSEFLKGQAILHYKIAENNKDYVSITPLMELNRHNDFTDDEGTYKNDVKTEVWSGFLNNYHKDTQGFERIGDYLIGYPGVGHLIPAELNHYEGIYINLPYLELEVDEQDKPEELAVYSFDGEMIESKVYNDEGILEEEFNEKKSQIFNNSFIVFYVLLEEDMKLENAVDSFSNLNILVNGEQAEAYGTIVEKNIPNSGENELKSLVSLEVGEEDYLPKDGVLEVIYEIDSQSIYNSDALSNAETQADFQRIYSENVVTVNIEGTEFDLTYADNDNETVYFQP